MSNTPQTKKGLGTPVNAQLVCLVASIVGPFLGLGLIDPLTTFSAAAYVVSWGLAAFCLIKLRKTEPNLPRPYKIPGGLPMAWFAALSMVAILIMMFIPVHADEYPFASLSASFGLLVT